MLSEPAPVATDAPNHFAYQPALDGLRAIAVGVVVLYHLGYGWMRGGFMGVDAFFVLSGFLITSLLLQERAHSGTTHLGRFWSRRARRLLPAAYLMIALATWYATTVLPKFQFTELRGDALASVFYFANWHFITTDVSYFDLFRAPSPFQHLWSLAIEEQFYLVWPLVFAFTVHRARHSLRTLFAVCVAGVLGSQIVMIALYDSANPSRAYFATPARLGTILLGCALAVLVKARPNLAPVRARRWTGSAATVALLSVVLAWTRATPSREYFLGGDTIFALAFVVLLFSLQGVRTPVHRVLELPTLVWLGGISYAVYLWHWPVILYLDDGTAGLSGLPLDIARVAVTVTIALASTRLIEARVRHSTGRVLRWAVPATVAVVAVVVLTTTGASPAPRYLNRRGNAFPCTTASDRDLATARRMIERGGVPSVPGLRGASVAVVGDSRACSLLTGFDAAAPLIGASVGNGAVLGCGLVAQEFTLGELVSRTWAQQCLKVVPKQFALIRTAADVIVVWSGLEDADFLVHGRIVPAASSEHRDILRVRLETWLTEQVPSGTPVALVLIPLPTAANDESGVDLAIRRGAARLNRVYRTFALAHPDRVNLIRLDRFLCPHGAACGPEVAGVRPSPDGTHLNPTGAGLVVRWMLPQLDRIVTDAREPA